MEKSVHIPDSLWRACVAMFPNMTNDGFSRLVVEALRDKITAEHAPPIGPELSLENFRDAFQPMLAATVRNGNLYRWGTIWDTDVSFETSVAAVNHRYVVTVKRENYFT